MAGDDEIQGASCRRRTALHRLIGGWGQAAGASRSSFRVAPTGSDGNQQECPGPVTAGQWWDQLSGTIATTWASGAEGRPPKIGRGTRPGSCDRARGGSISRSRGRKGRPHQGISKRRGNISAALFALDFPGRGKRAPRLTPRTQNPADQGSENRGGISTGEPRDIQDRG